MVQEAYVSFETAKLLKEKGFRQIQENCGYFTTEMVYGVEEDEQGEHHFAHQYPACMGNKKDCIAAPTQAMAMRWLREVHNIFLFVYPQFKRHVEIEPDKTSYFEFNGWSGKPMILKEKMIDIIGLDEVSGVFGSYEEVCEAGIKYCLEHLI